jgi:hypothetical protein
MAAAAATASVREATSTGTDRPMVVARWAVRTYLTSPPLRASGLAASRAPGQAVVAAAVAATAVLLLLLVVVVLVAAAVVAAVAVAAA